MSALGSRGDRIQLVPVKPPWVASAPPPPRGRGVPASQSREPDPILPSKHEQVLVRRHLHPGVQTQAGGSSVTHDTRRIDPIPERGTRTAA